MSIVYKIIENIKKCQKFTFGLWKDWYNFLQFAIGKTTKKLKFGEIASKGR